MEKKGLGHVEVIVSFVLFLTGMGFVLYYFVPLIHYNSGLNENLIDSVANSIESKVTIYSIIVDNSGNQIAKNNPGNSIGLNINDSRNFAVFDDNGILNSKREGGIIYTNKSWAQKEIIYVIFSDVLPASSSNLKTVSVNEGFYKVGAVQNLNVVSEKKINEMNNSYYEDYDLLKENLDIGKGENFNFKAYFEGNEIGSEKEIPYGSDIESSEKSVQILTNEGKIVPGKIEVMKW